MLPVDHRRVTEGNPSIHVKHPLNFWLTVLRVPGDYLNVGEVRAHLHRPRAMGVTAKNRHALLRMLLHELQQHLASRHIREVWCPIVVGEMPIVPARFTEWRNVHQHYNVVTAIECCGEHATEMVGCFVFQCIPVSRRIWR